MVSASLATSTSPIGLVAERQILQDSIAVGRCKDWGLSQRPATFGALALKQMAPAGSVKQYFSARGDLEPFSHRLPGFNSLGASHRGSLLWLSLCPVLRPPAILCCRTSECQDLRHLEAHFFLDDFTQGDIRHAILGMTLHEWPARAPIAGV